MPPEDTKLLGFNQYRKSDKARSKYFIKKVDGCKDYPENHLQQKQVNIFPVDIQMSTIRTFDGTEEKHDIYRGEDF